MWWRRCAIAATACAAMFAQSPKYGVGRTPTPEEIRAQDITIPPDGAGLPEGRGTAAEGRDIYSRRCQRCHGAKGEGGDEPKQSTLVGGIGSLKTPKPLKTVGSYWPYAPTLWDYVNRAMPLDRPGTLTHNQVYALVAFVLHMNGIVGENDVLDAKTLPKIRMPNRDGFVRDPRPDVGKSVKKKAAAKTSGS
ncbi:MAG TPA: cytochrome c [Bryobacteraceae bacterium]|nr:cytochrome c [Bryobacteraceae bacterium]